MQAIGAIFFPAILAVGMLIFLQGLMLGGIAILGSRRDPARGDAAALASPSHCLVRPARAAAGIAPPAPGRRLREPDAAALAPFERCRRHQISSACARRGPHRGHRA
jgi:hypothetical protein